MTVVIQYTEQTQLTNLDLEIIAVLFVYAVINFVKKFVTSSQ